MGLDQYLYAEVGVPKGTLAFEAIEKHLTDDHRQQLMSNETAYVSGWSYGDTKPEELFNALSMELGITPAHGSPHFDLEKEGDLYRVRACIYYWRKANAIHRWFVEKAQDGVDECQMTEVHPELLLDLMERIEEVALNHDRAAELLPTQGGFFFGPTEYSEWYFEDIETTSKELRPQIATVPTPVKFFYTSSW